MFAEMAAQHAARLAYEERARAREAHVAAELAQMAAAYEVQHEPRGVDEEMGEGEAKGEEAKGEEARPEKKVRVVARYVELTDGDLAMDVDSDEDVDLNGPGTDEASSAESEDEIDLNSDTESVVVCD